MTRRGCIRHNDDPATLKEELDVEMEIFQNYSRPACLMECRARHLQEECGCLPYYFPNFGVVWKKDVSCNVTGLICLAKLKSKSHWKFL